MGIWGAVYLYVFSCGDQCTSTRAKKICLFSFVTTIMYFVAVVIHIAVWVYRKLFYQSYLWAWLDAGAQWQFTKDVKGRACWQLFHQITSRKRGIDIHFVGLRERGRDMRGKFSCIPLGQDVDIAAYPTLSMMLIRENSPPKMAFFWRRSCVDPPQRLIYTKHATSCAREFAVSRCTCDAHSCCRVAHSYLWACLERQRCTCWRASMDAPSTPFQRIFERKCDLHHVIWAVSVCVGYFV